MYMEGKNIVEKEEVIVRQARDGDIKAFGKLVSRYQNRMFGFIKSRLGVRTTGQEIIQETFTTAFLKIRYLEDSHKFSSWLFAICRNKINEHIRKNNKRMIDDSIDPELLADQKQIFSE